VAHAQQRGCVRLCSPSMLSVVVRNDDLVLNNDVLEHVGAGSREVFGSSHAEVRDRHQDHSAIVTCWRLLGVATAPFYVPSPIWAR